MYFLQPRTLLLSTGLFHSQGDPYKVQLGRPTGLIDLDASCIRQSASPPLLRARGRVEPRALAADVARLRACSRARDLSQFASDGAEEMWINSGEGGCVGGGGFMRSIQIERLYQGEQRT